MRIALWRSFAVASLLIAPAIAAAQESDIQRRVLFYKAPFVVQETNRYDGIDVTSDQILPVDFDGDWDTRNNESHILSGPINDTHATVYYSLVETGTSSEDGYYFLGYYFYHPHDLGPSLLYDTYNPGGHENDLEGIVLAVQKSVYYPYGSVKAALSEAHGALIPYTIASLYNSVTAVGGGWQGRIEFWPDARLTQGRAIVIARSHGHGTYAAQDGGDLCSDYFTVDLGYGVDGLSPQNYGTQIACVHGDNEAIYYDPPDYPANVADALPFYAANHGYFFRLVDLSTTPLWTNRAESGALYTGNLVSLLYGQQGYDQFAFTDKGGATPVWEWRGGRGQCKSGLLCWYSFGTDGTDHWQNVKSWPQLAYGQLLQDPDGAFTARMTGLPGLGAPYRYNPFHPLPPPPPPAFEASIEGPETMNVGQTCTFVAAATNGTEPYTYRWSGIATGADGSVSVTGVQGGSGTLYLDVFDAAGHHAAVAQFVVTDDPTAHPCFQ